MGNKASTASRSLAMLGRQNSKKRAPFAKQTPKAPVAEKPAPGPVSSIVDPKAPHPNPYYSMPVTEQDLDLVGKAFSGKNEPYFENMENLPRPLGTDHIDFSKLDIEARQTKDEDLHAFVQSLVGAISEKNAPGAMPTLEEQVAALHFIGADPREIAVIQRRIEKRDANLLEEKNKKARESIASPISGSVLVTNQRIVISRSMIDDMAQEPESWAEGNKTFLESQYPSSDPFPDLIAASHASRSHAPDLETLAAEPVFRHDPLQNLPSKVAKSIPTNLSEKRRDVPGLATTEQMDLLITSADLPPNFPISKKDHIQLLRDAIKPAKTTPIETNERKYRHRFTRETA